MKKIDVSVIYLVYNPDYIEYLKTLYSIICQKDINFEIIICDDNSNSMNYYETENIIRGYNIPVSIIENDVNVGTVKNYLRGVLSAKGKYVYGISPGDYIFDQFTLRDFFKFAECNNIEVCFGRSQFYQKDDGETILEKRHRPTLPDLYSKEKSDYRTIVAFFFGQQVVGPAYFRKKDTFEYYLEKIKDKVIYVEDNTTTMYHLLNNGNINFYDRYIVYYKYNSGVSSHENKLWINKIENDWEQIYQILKHGFPKSRLVKSRFCKNKFKRNIIYPYILLIKLYYKVKEKLHGDTSIIQLNSFYHEIDNITSINDFMNY